MLLEQRAAEGPVVSQITSGLTDDLADAINARMTLIEDRLDRLEGKRPRFSATSELSRD